MQIVNLRLQQSDHQPYYIPLLVLASILQANLLSVIITQPIVAGVLPELLYFFLSGISNTPQTKPGSAAAAWGGSIQVAARDTFKPAPIATAT